jgi:aspartate aminotransferase-like enzyme
MEAYEGGAHAYHATMPTDALVALRDVMRRLAITASTRCATSSSSLAMPCARCSTRAASSVAAPGFQAPGVVVSYTDDADMQSGKKFARAGLQIAAGVPLQCDERPDFQSFRIGLFGLDKLHNPARTVKNLEDALDRLQS